jgi:hypothetical protein
MPLRVKPFSSSIGLINRAASTSVHPDIGHPRNQERAASCRWYKKGTGYPIDPSSAARRGKAAQSVQAFMMGR